MTYTLPSLCLIYVKGDDNLKKLSLSLLSLSLVFSLAACNNASGFEAYTKAYKNLNEAKTLDTTSSISFNVKSGSVTPEDQQVIDILNSAKIKIESKADLENKKAQSTLYASFEAGMIKPEFELPILADEKEKVAYIKLDSVIDEVSGIVPLSPEITELKGKLVEVELNDTQDINTVELEQELTEVIEEFVSSIPEKDYVKAELTSDDKDKGAAYKVNLAISDAQTKELLEKVITKTAVLSGETVTEADLDSFRESLKNVSFDEVSLSALISKDNQFIEQTFNFSLSGDQDGESINVDVNFNVVYNEINKPVTFDIKPTKDNVIPANELSVLMPAMAY